MSWRIIQITQPGALRIKNRQLVYIPQEGTEVTLPLEDVSVLILENDQIALNSYFLSALADFNIVLFVSDATHTPSGAFYPFHQHSRTSEIAWQQVALTEPFKKRVWQEVVKAKISNQSSCLQALGSSYANPLQEMVKQVQSGDAKNTEAFAAGLYWSYLFKAFNRHDDLDGRNAALNYGYAIIRGCMARAVVGAGLLPCFGIHHANKLNAFNLVDDLMEPLRPYVDYCVKKWDVGQKDTLTPALKHKLVQVLTHLCVFQGEEITILKATERIATNFVNAMKAKEGNSIVLPMFKPFK